MSTDTAVIKRKLVIETDEGAYKAYRRYCPDHIYAWDHLTMEERLAWRHVAQAMPPEEEQVPESEQPKVKTLGQIAYEGMYVSRGVPWWRVEEQEAWEAGAQAVAVAVLHMRYDEFTPELKVAANRGMERGTAWVNCAWESANREDTVLGATQLAVKRTFIEVRDLTPAAQHAIELAIENGVLAGLKAWHEAKE